MKCASALSTAQVSDTAIDEVVSRLREGLGGETADLAVIFGSPQHRESLGPLALALLDKRLARHVIGCTGEAIAGDDREIEDGPALSAFAARMPGVTIKTRWLTEYALELPDEDIEDRTVIVLGDPFTFPADEFLQAVDDSGGNVRVIGGMASAGDSPGANRFILDHTVMTAGAVTVTLSGPVTIDTVVSQGCRPIGRPMIVTKAERGVIHELGRRSAAEVAREVIAELSRVEQKRLRQGVHIGRVINEYQESFRPGDFLVRNVLGVYETGGLGINDHIRVGQTVQFHVRDAETADEELRSLLEAEDAVSVHGALLFSCNGRGTRLFPGPNHDVGVIREIVGPVPLAGFFAMGELGPVGGQNFVHGFTASVALFKVSE
jgi:small ligand-binding sensory domain FIST